MAISHFIIQSYNYLYIRSPVLLRKQFVLFNPNKKTEAA